MVMHFRERAKRRRATAEQGRRDEARARRRRRAILEPVAWGAAGLAALTLFRALFVVPMAVLAGRPHVAASALAAVALASAAGAAAGLAYALVGAPLRRMGGGHPYLAGVVAAAAYLGAVFALLAWVAPKAGMDFGGPAAWVSLAICAMFFGTVVVGREFAKEDRAAAAAGGEREAAT